MKLTRTFIGLSSVALALMALIVMVHHVAHAKEALPAIHVDATPADRSPGSGNSYGTIVKKVASSVVNIYSTRFVKQRVYRDPLEMMMRQMFGNQVPDSSREFTRRDNWLGSGMIVTPDGYILTANHVVDGADEVEVGISNDKTQYAAKIIGTDPATDIAVLKIEAADLPAITLGDSSQLEVGDVTLAIGNPFGVGQTVTRGIISALGRSLPMDQDQSDPSRSAHYQDFIQTDASINQGNSGGALVDAQGRLIGINDAIVSPSGTSAGIGFAIPINLARTVMEGFLNGGRVARGYLGVDLQDLDPGLAKSFGVPTSGGAIVADVGPGSPAATAGLKSGDVIVAVDDQPVTGVENLKVTISQLRPGSKAVFKIIRDGAELKLTATLAEKQFPNADAAPPASSAVTQTPKADALDGVQVEDLNQRLRRQLGAPPDVNGAVVTVVDNASNSAIAGLRRGDVILEINHQNVAAAVDAFKLGHAAKIDQILIKVWRPNGELGMIRFFSVNNARRAK
ncbi:MAG TPA: Do family serine endopeptidase [Verrucomicrobiae bacterium]|nr:Do family serine endopeptidase [Verrucomicrobiae bacterium]